MNRLALTLLLFLALANESDARNACAESRHRSRLLSFAKTTINPFLEQYDVTYVKIDLTLTNQSTAINGNASTRGTVTSSSGMTRYLFELSDQLKIDSVIFNGQNLPFTNAGADMKSVTLPATLAQGAVFTARVYYSGTPANGTGFFTHALNNVTLGSGTKITYSLSDPYLAKEWWPCKQSLTDKVDSADLWFTVPAGTKAGSNGLLGNVTPLGANNRYEWKTRYPIEYYLISVAVSAYAERKQMLYFSGSIDSMSVIHYVYDTATFYPAYASALDSTPVFVDYFSSLFGRYPFWKEKYGHCISPLSGGMEHQTMTTLGNNYATTLISHELGHQWWGDHVTYTSWRDIWLSEGFASYCEQLYQERFRGKAAMKSYRTAVYNRVMGGAGGSVYVDDTTNVYRIFDSRLTYDKGAAVAHMLRYLAPADSLFFKGLRTYQQKFAFRTATTDSFKAVMQQAYGMSLDSFFNQWVYGQGYPTYAGSWNQIGNQVHIVLTQSTSAPLAVSSFNLPVRLQLRNSTGNDTVVTVDMYGSSRYFNFTWGGTMTDVAVDPEDEIVNRAFFLVQDPALSAASAWPAQLVISPNPAEDGWNVAQLPAGSDLRLLDMQGRMVWEQHNAAGEVRVNSRHLPAGVYTLQVKAGGKAASYKLIHQ